jgi:hypothetical protein|tara:strand:+ start:129 stop:779 length:651 start_codon:yes stop_codon:yes gene_type:complete
MSGEARDKAQRDSELQGIMERGVSDKLENWKQLARKPGKCGGHFELYNFGSPKAKWRQQIFKYGPLDVVHGEQVLNFSGSIAGNPNAPVKIEQITLYCETALSSSVYVDKVGINGRVLEGLSDTDYFYTGSTHAYADNGNVGHFVSGAASALIAGQARAGAVGYTASDLWMGGWFTGSADVTVTLNKSPTGTGTSLGATGSFYLYVYADKVWKAFP